VPDWTALETDLAAWLQGFAGHGLRYCGPYQCIEGFPVDGFRSDGLLTNGRSLIALEVEAGQMHPDTNVGKYWLLSEHHEYSSVVLFHIYTPRFNSYGWRKALGEFYAKRMTAELPFEYVLLDFRNANDYETTLAEIQGIVGERVRRVFSTELQGHAA
jgi:hypothetical protein